MLAVAVDRRPFRGALAGAAAIGRRWDAASPDSVLRRYCRRVCRDRGADRVLPFGIATLSYLALTTPMPLAEIVINRMDDGISNLLLLAVPDVCLSPAPLDGDDRHRPGDG